MINLQRKKTIHANLITYGMVTALFLLFQTLSMMGVLSNLFKGLLVPFTIYIIMTVSLNLTVGILGELSLGHAGFMCIGAFSGAIFSNIFVGSMPKPILFLVAIIIGAAVAGIFGFLIGIPVMRLRGDYLAIVTLAFGEIIKNIINSIYMGIDSKGVHISLKDTLSLGLEENGKILMKGAQGITGTPTISNFFYGFLLVMLTLFVVINLRDSRAGRCIMSIRDNRIAAESIGIPIMKYKLLAFSISAALAGTAGVLYAHNLTTLSANPKQFGYNMSIMILVYVVLGGLGNIRGSVIAAVVLYALPELLRGINDYRMLIYSIVLILTMLFNNAPMFIEYRKKISASIRVRFKREESV